MAIGVTVVGAGLHAHIKNHHVNTAQRWLGGFAPLRVLVPEDQADEAREIMQGM